MASVPRRTHRVPQATAVPRSVNRVPKANAIAQFCRLLGRLLPPEEGVH